jgi:hypothetical protein
MSRSFGTKKKSGPDGRGSVHALAHPASICFGLTREATKKPSSDCGRGDKAIRLFRLKWTCKLAAVILALCVWGTPLMACLVSDTLTEAERECCQQMADNCGSGMMADSHSCCKTTVQQIDSYLAHARFDLSFSYPAAIPVAEIDFSIPFTFTQAQLSHGHSPPVSPPETVSILRI